MLHILEAVRPGEHQLLEAAFRLRYQTFVIEKKWVDLARPDGREIDQFDTISAVYLIVTKDDTDEVIGNLRLLPTWKPHLLSTVHRHIWTEPYPVGQHVWEWTRYSIDPNYRGGKAFGSVASQLTLGAVEWGLENNVTDVVVELHPYLVPRFGELGFHVRPLGLPEIMDGDPVIAVHMTYDQKALNTLREVRGISTPIQRTMEMGETITGKPLSRRS